MPTIGVFLVRLRKMRRLRFANDSTGAFVAAPLGGLLWGLFAFGLRIALKWMLAKAKGHRFDAFDRPPPVGPAFYTGNADDDHNEEDRETVGQESTYTKGSFF